MVLRRRKAKSRGFTNSLSVNVSSNNEKNDNSPAAPETLSDEAKRNMTNRLSRIVGHLQSIKRMIEGDRDIESTLVQASAVRAAVNGLCKELLKELVIVRSKNKSQELAPNDVDEILVLVNRYIK